MRVYIYEATAARADRERIRDISASKRESARAYNTNEEKRRKKKFF